ncbi:hypothetical protein [Polaromonas sp. CG_23.6]|uniref:hypothetical protein n=1 Tax=Polaromonas sp. CG_23.6 TaxID=2760709 RepID=UPI00247474D0|nr:hypothetical protein [Polaromonas sp. CG_23.6]
MNKTGRSFAGLWFAFRCIKRCQHNIQWPLEGWKNSQARVQAGRIRVLSETNNLRLWEPSKTLMRRPVEQLV